MMKFIKKLEPLHVLKAVGVVLLVVMIGALGLRLVGSSFDSVLNKKYSSSSQAPTVGYGGMGGGGYPDYDYAMEESADGAYGAELSIRNTGIIPPYPGGGNTVGDDAEEYEVTDYRGTIETRDLNRTCSEVTSLKSLDYVIFENSNESEKYCNYSFKVERDREEEILSRIQDLNPRELTENTYTIKNVIEDYTSELEILTNKLDAIDETLSSAIDSYDDITRIAVSANDADALAKIIDSKIRLIERLTQEKINVNSQIDRFQRSKAQQLDRLDYVYFHISVYESKIIDGQALRDSWKRSLQEFVGETNRTLQDLTVNLLAFLLNILQFIIYIVIGVYVAKYLWKWGKKTWKS